MMPRTSDNEIGLQMQIEGGKGFPNVLYGGNQEEVMKSISLQPGYEYLIELEPFGQLSTDDFKAMSLNNRQCHLDHEIFENSTHPIYTKANCRFDCHVDIAYRTCKCVPWDFVNKLQNAVECDIFGRTCFFNMIETLSHSSDQNCTYCVEECDKINYRKRVTNRIKLDLVKEKYYDEFYSMDIRYCNKYICINPTRR